ncbi:MAG TPA: DUF5615 family PIN-like protein [Candidatus Krumholzibacteria bacterium]
MKPIIPTHIVQIRFYAELNDFLPAPRRHIEFEHAFEGMPAVRDVVGSLGVPHPEIDVILVNGISVGLGHRIHDGDRIAVYPVFEALDVGPLQRLRSLPLRITRFALDCHLGRLARALRLLGFDASYQRDVRDPDLIAQARSEGRIILTRDRELLKARVVTHGIWIRSTNPREQVLQVLDRFDLRARARPFTRCTVCNGELAAVYAETVHDEVPPRVWEQPQEYFRCIRCRKVYWRGTHAARLQEFVDAVLGPRTASD